MAGIIKRFSDIMSANLNALLDKAEDPEKMIDQYLRNLESDLGKVKAETASVMAEETKCKRELDEFNADIVAGNDNDARQFLEKKQQLVSKQAALQQAYDLAHGNAVKMKEMHDKLVSDMGELQSRRDAIRAKVAVAKTQERLNKVGSSVAGVSNNLSAFDRMEEKANRMLDEANAMSELNTTKDDVADLAAKYDEDSSNTGVDDELAALKAKLGK